MQISTAVHDVNSPSEHERRAHIRVGPQEISQPPTLRIPERPAIALVDLSTGGALLDLPFALRVDSRVTVEVATAADRFTVAFRLLRCTASTQANGVRYRAAGAFERRLDLIPLLARTPSASARPAFTLDVYLRPASTAIQAVKAPDFDPMLGWMLDAVRRGESPHAIASGLRARLDELFPSMVITRATAGSLPNPSRGARFFGIDFTTERALSGTERRVLKAAAQFLAIDTAL